jgi:hypothetical protein
MKSLQGMKKLPYNIALPVSASRRDIAPITLSDDEQGLARVEEGVSSPSSRCDLQ